MIRRFGRHGRKKWIVLNNNTTQRKMRNEEKKIGEQTADCEWNE